MNNPVHKNGLVKWQVGKIKTLTTILQPAKNIGFSSSARATEPQVSEGKIMLALKIIKLAGIVCGEIRKI